MNFFWIRTKCISPGSLPVNPVPFVNAVTKKQGEALGGLPLVKPISDFYSIILSSEKQ